MSLLGVWVVVSITGARTSVRNRIAEFIPLPVSTGYRSGLKPGVLLRAEARAPSPLVVEDVEPDAREVSIQVIARIPQLTARQADALDELVSDLPREIDGYSRPDILTVTNGDCVRVLAGPDYIRISFSVLPGNWRAGISLAEALARNSKLTPPSKPSVVTPSAWTSALRPYLRGRAPRPSEVEALYHSLFRPDNLVLGVGGAITLGLPAADWEGRMANWEVARATPASRFEQYPAPMTKNPGGLDSLELTGPTFGAGDAALPTRVLVLFALGSGKGASLFRIARQRLQYSYRQEALLYPSPDGWQPRILLLMKPGADLAGRGETLRKVLLQDVDAWTEADRRRALGMADAVFLRNVNFSPFAFGPAGALDGSLEGRTFLRAYWRMKTGRPWDAPAFLAMLREVRLDDLKSMATDLLTQAKPRLLPAS